MFRIATKLAFRPAGIYCYPLHVHYPCRGVAGSTAPKKRTNQEPKTASLQVTTEEDTTSTRKKQTTNLKCCTAYSKISMLEAEDRLGFLFVNFERLAIPVGQMLVLANPENQGLTNDQVQQTKEMVFENIVRFIESEGYPSELDEDFNEANVNDLVFLIILPILTELKRETGRNLLLRREKEIIATDGETGSFREFVRMDFIGVRETKFVLVVEAMMSSVGAKRQCLLALKDMWDDNGGGIVYGFVTSGGQWQMIRYDRMGFTQTDHFQVLFATMGNEKERWMRECSVIVDCIHMALRNGGCVGA